MLVESGMQGRKLHEVLAAIERVDRRPQQSDRTETRAREVLTGSCASSS